MINNSGVQSFLEKVGLTGIKVNNNGMEVEFSASPTEDQIEKIKKYGFQNVTRNKDIIEKMYYMPANNVAAFEKMFLAQAMQEADAQLLKQKAERQAKQEQTRDAQTPEVQTVSTNPNDSMVDQERRAALIGSHEARKKERAAKLEEKAEKARVELIEEKATEQETLESEEPTSPKSKKGKARKYIGRALNKVIEREKLKNSKYNMSKKEAVAKAVAPGLVVNAVKLGLQGAEVLGRGTIEGAGILGNKAASGARLVGGKAAEGAQFAGKKAAEGIERAVQAGVEAATSETAKNIAKGTAIGLAITTTGGLAIPAYGVYKGIQKRKEIKGAIQGAFKGLRDSRKSSAEKKAEILKANQGAQINRVKAAKAFARDNTGVDKKMAEKELQRAIAHQERDTKSFLKANNASDRFKNDSYTTGERGKAGGVLKRIAHGAEKGWKDATPKNTTTPKEGPRL